MRKSVKKRIVKTSAFFEIFLMISLTIAFAVFMSESVSAEFKGATGNTYSESDYYINDKFQIISKTDGSIADTSIVRNTGSATSSGASGATVPTQTSSTPTPSGTQSRIGYSGEVTVGGEKYTKLSDGSWYDNTGNNEITRTSNPDLFAKLESTKADKASYSYKSPFGVISGGWGHLAQGLSWSIQIVGAIQLLGGLFGLDKGITNSLSYSAFGGIMTAKLLASAGPGGFAGGQSALNSVVGAKAGNWMTSGTGQLVIGAGIAVAIFLLTYKKESKKTVSFACLPWEAPTGGNKCEECNKDIFRPCTEYRCKSLGQACELLDANTPNAKCAWKSVNDAKSATITPWDEALKPVGLKYSEDKVNIRPPAIGVKITPSNAKCLPAFTPLEFGFTTNEPAQCKIDYTHTNTFKDMQHYVGDNNYYEYNHTQKMRLPGPVNDTASPLYIKNDGTMGLYVRCKDANGNENVDEYVFTFCVDAGPDTTPPVMEEFSLPSGSFVTYKADNVPIELYVNEPAECKWSRQDKNYDEMENIMKCYNSVDQLNPDLQYTCRGNVTGVEDMKDNSYYFRCKDNAGNKNVASKQLILKGSQPLNIKSILPNETVTGSTEYVSVDLQVETEDGAQEGKAICYFSETGETNAWIQMFETDNYLHKQTLSLRDGQYKYYIRCVDYGGNMAQNSTEFDVFVDKDAPIVTRVYKENALKIVTDEDARCFYSLSNCNYEIKDGTEMIYSNPDIMDRLFAEWKSGQTYYIKCQDLYGNQPSPNYCSIVVNSVELSKGQETE